jgi:hypothetical protein
MSPKDNVEYITVGGTKIKCEISELEILGLQYYLENPRVNSVLSQYSKEKVDQQVIEEELWKLDSTKDLFRDIKQHGGLIEEVIVRGKEVLEGNSRLCAYRQLYKKAATDEKACWRYIRAKVIPDETTQEQIFVILGILHIKGKAEWRTYEKAAYLYKMNVVFGRNVSDISSMIGISDAEIKNMIQSYETMNHGNVTELEKFSFFVEFFKNRELAKIKEEDPTVVVRFVEWVKRDRIPRAESVRDLPLILKDKKARKLFVNQDEDFEYCLNIASTRHPDRVDTFYRNLKKATRTIAEAPIPKIKEDIENNANKKDIVRKLIRETKSFGRNLGLD